MFFNSYFSDYNNEMIGGGKCSICNEEGHNARTCKKKSNIVEKNIKIKPKKVKKTKKVAKPKTCGVNESTGRCVLYSTNKSHECVLKPNGKCGRIDKAKPKKAASPPPPVNEKITDECYLKSSTKANLNHERSRQRLDSWVLPDRTEFQDWLQSIYSDVHNSRKSRSDKEFFSHQEFVINYLQKNSPYRGLLLYHGLGAGKTASSVAISDGLNSDKKIVVMLPASLRTNYENEIKQWGNMMFKKNQYWCFVKSRTNSKLESKLVDRGIPTEWIRKTGKKTKKYQGAWLVDSKKKGENPTLLEDDKKEIERQINYLLKEKYTILHYNNTNTIIKQIYEQVPYTKKSLGKITKEELEELVYNTTIVEPEKNPFNDKILIVDEIHNLISMMIGGGFNGPILYRLLMTARRVKYVFLSGTPLINYPYEAGILCNILKGYSKSYIINVRQEEDSKSVDELIETLRREVLTIDRVEYNKGKLLVVRNPAGFISLWNRSKYKGVFRQADDYEREEVFLNNINQVLLKLRWLKIGKTDIYNNPTFPEIINESRKLPNNRSGKLNFKKGLEIATSKFERYFISTSNKIKNSELFMRRILGSISYYKRVNKSELFPTTLNYDGSRFNSESQDRKIEILMSNWQLEQYIDVREIERNKDRNLATKKPKQRLNMEINQQAKKSSNLYRIMSRQRCNFVFPPNIDRPRPYKKLELEDEVSEDVGLSELDESVDEYDYLTRLEIAINNLSTLNLVNSSSPQYLNLVPMFKKYKVFKNPSESSLIDEYSLETLSPKFNSMLNYINDSPGLVFLYSQFRSVEGIEIFSKVLSANGYKKFSLENENTKIPFNLYDMVSSSDPDNYLCGRIVDFNYNVTDELLGLAESVKEIELSRFNLLKIKEELEKVGKPFLEFDTIIKDMYDEKIFKSSNFDFADKSSKVDEILASTKTYVVLNLNTNELEEYQEKEISHSYYALWTGTEDPSEREIVRNKFNESNNKYGSKIKILMITSSGAEGISLKNVRQVHIMEPYWNRVRIEQVIGRAARINSHVELPKSKQNIRVYEYIVKLNKKQQKLPIASSIMVKDSGLTSDEVLYKISDIKSKILYGFLTLMKRASIDCRFNELDNKMSGDDFECFEFAEGASEEVEYSTTLNISNADKDAHKDVKVEKRLDKYINIEFPTPFKNKAGKNLKAKLKIKLEHGDEEGTILNMSEPRLLYDFYTNNKIPLGFIYKGRYFFIKPKFMNEVIKKEMPLERVLNNLNKMRLSKEEIKTLMLPWIKLEIQRMKMK